MNAQLPDNYIETKVFPLWARMTIGILSLVMFATSMYLTIHFYESHFPSGYSGGALCNLSGFWNCDLATFSPLGQIWDVPTAIFGAFWAFLLFVGVWLRNQWVMRSHYFISIINAIFCVGLFAYSLVYLHGLCPGCTIYYICSWLVLLVFIVARIEKPIPHMGALFGYFGLLAIVVFLTFQFNKEKFAKQNELAGQVVEQFLASPSYEVYSIKAPHRFASGVDDEAKAPLRILLFSDFQCPACKMFANLLPKIIAKYWGKAIVEYVYFPLDSQCNPWVSKPIHPQACLAARLVACVPEKFEQLHDEIYEKQQNLSNAWLEARAKELNALDCMNGDESLQKVQQIIQATEPYEINATPTLFVNGHKIDGLMPLKFFYVLIDGVLAKSMNKS